MCYLTQVILPRAYVLLLNISFDRTSRNFVVKRRYKNARMTSVLFKMADVNVGYFKVNLHLLKHLHLKYARKRIHNAMGAWDGLRHFIVALPEPYI